MRLQQQITHTKAQRHSTLKNKTVFSKDVNILITISTNSEQEQSQKNFGTQVKQITKYVFSVL